MKKTILLCLIIIMFGCTKKEKIENVFHLDVKNNVEFEYASDVYIDSLVNSNDIRIINEEQELDTYSLGEHTFNIEYIKDETKYNEEIKYNVVDTTKPLVLINSSYTITKGTKKDLVNMVLCADNYDKRPNCYIEGNYDVNKVGTYNLQYIAIDSSNNKSIHSFKLKVVKPAKEKNDSKDKPKFQIKDLINDYKKDNTMIGIDISSWQSNIDFQKVKDSGVEFVMIRLGFGHNKNNELVLDNKFERNIKKAKEANLKVGIYFYSYANSIDKVKEQVNYILEKLNGEFLDLPIAFDWEDWSKFNKYNISLTDINLIAQTFIDEIKKHNYEAALYSSKYYLEKIWGINKYNTWLAHYTNNTSYKGKYFMWQLSNRGKVPGINGDVDLDILYK